MDDSYGSDDFAAYEDEVQHELNKQATKTRDGAAAAVVEKPHVNTNDLNVTKEAEKRHKAAQSQQKAAQVASARRLTEGRGPETKVIPSFTSAADETVVMPRRKLLKGEFRPKATMNPKSKEWDDMMARLYNESDIRKKFDYGRQLKKAYEKGAEGKHSAIAWGHLEKMKMGHSRQDDTDNCHFGTHLNIGQHNEQYWNEEVSVSLVAYHLGIDLTDLPDKGAGPIDVSLGSTGLNCKSDYFAGCFHDWEEHNRAVKEADFQLSSVEQADPVDQDKITAARAIKETKMAYADKCKFSMNEKLGLDHGISNFLSKVLDYKKAFRTFAATGGENAGLKKSMQKAASAMLRPVVEKELDDMSKDDLMKQAKRKMQMPEKANEKLTLTIEQFFDSENGKWAKYVDSCCADIKVEDKDGQRLSENIIRSAKDKRINNVANFLRVADFTITLDINQHGVKKEKKRQMDDKKAMKMGIVEHKRKDPAHFNEVYLPPDDTMKIYKDEEKKMIAIAGPKKASMLDDKANSIWYFGYSAEQSDIDMSRANGWVPNGSNISGESNNDEQLLLQSPPGNLLVECKQAKKSQPPSGAAPHAAKCWRFRALSRTYGDPGGTKVKTPSRVSFNPYEHFPVHATEEAIVEGRESEDFCWKIESIKLYTDKPRDMDSVTCMDDLDWKPNDPNREAKIRRSLKFAVDPGTDLRDYVEVCRGGLGTLIPHLRWADDNGKKMSVKWISPELTPKDMWAERLCVYECHVNKKIKVPVNPERPNEKKEIEANTVVLKFANDPKAPVVGEFYNPTIRLTAGIPLSGGDSHKVLEGRTPAVFTRKDGRGEGFKAKFNAYGEWVGIKFEDRVEVNYFVIEGVSADNWPEKGFVLESTNTAHIDASWTTVHEYHVKPTFDFRRKVVKISVPQQQSGDLKWVPAEVKPGVPSPAGLILVDNLLGINLNMLTREAEDRAETNRKIHQKKLSILAEHEYTIRETNRRHRAREATKLKRSPEFILSQAELHKLEEMFYELDDNADEFLSKEELVNGMNKEGIVELLLGSNDDDGDDGSGDDNDEPRRSDVKVLSLPEKQEAIKSILKAMDSDGDEKVSLPEFKGFFAKRSKVNKAQRYPDVFRVFLALGHGTTADAALRWDQIEDMFVEKKHKASAQLSPRQVEMLQCVFGVLKKDTMDRSSKIGANVAKCSVSQQFLGRIIRDIPAMAYEYGLDRDPITSDVARTVNMMIDSPDRLATFKEIEQCFGKGGKVNALGETQAPPRQVFTQDAVEKFAKAELIQRHGKVCVRFPIGDHDPEKAPETYPVVWTSHDPKHLLVGALQSAVVPVTAVGAEVELEFPSSEGKTLSAKFENPLAKPPSCLEPCHAEKLKTFFERKFHATQEVRDAMRMRVAKAECELKAAKQGVEFFNAPYIEGESISGTDEAVGEGRASSFAFDKSIGLQDNTEGGGGGVGGAANAPVVGKPNKTRVQKLNEQIEGSGVAKLAAAEAKVERLTLVLVSQKWKLDKLDNACATPLEFFQEITESQEILSMYGSEMAEALHPDNLEADRGGWVKDVPRLVPTWWKKTMDIDDDDCWPFDVLNVVKSKKTSMADVYLPDDIAATSPGGSQLSHQTKPIRPGGPKAKLSHKDKVTGFVKMWQYKQFLKRREADLAMRAEKLAQAERGEPRKPHGHKSYKAQYNKVQLRNKQLDKEALAIASVGKVFRPSNDPVIQETVESVGRKRVEEVARPKLQGDKPIPYSPKIVKSWLPVVFGLLKERDGSASISCLREAMKVGGWGPQMHPIRAATGTHYPTDEEGDYIDAQKCKDVYFEICRDTYAKWDGLKGFLTDHSRFFVMSPLGDLRPRVSLKRTAKQRQNDFINSAQRDLRERSIRNSYLTKVVKSEDPIEINCTFKPDPAAVRESLRTLTAQERMVKQLAKEGKLPGKETIKTNA